MSQTVTQFQASQNNLQIQGFLYQVYFEASVNGICLVFYFLVRIAYKRNLYINHNDPKDEGKKEMGYSQPVHVFVSWVPEVPVPEGVVVSPEEVHSKGAFRALREHFTIVEEARDVSNISIEYDSLKEQEHVSVDVPYNTEQSSGESSELVYNRLVEIELDKGLNDCQYILRSCVEIPSVIV